MAIVSIKNVSKSYGKKKVLDCVSFDIKKGEIFGLLGSNGAGKSTLSRIILGFEKQSDGKVLLFDSKSVDQVKMKIGFVPQETAFYKEFTVQENMEYFASLYNLEDMKEINALIDWFNLAEFKDTRADLLSGGYQRMLNTAISIINDPEIIFLDEPTVGLDPQIREMFWEKVEQFQEAGKTIIVTTHYMDEAEEFCDRIALLKKGKLLCIGSPQELIRKYGGIKIIILETSEKMTKKDLEKINEKLDDLKAETDENMLFIPTLQKNEIGLNMEIMEYLIEKGYKIISSTTKEPTLENVFLNLTGEKMKS